MNAYSQNERKNLFKSNIFNKNDSQLVYNRNYNKKWFSLFKFNLMIEALQIHSK